MLARPLERLVIDARRRGEKVDAAVLDALGDCERVRRLLVAVAGSASGTAEPESEVDVVQQGHDLDTSAVADLLGCSQSYVRRLARQRQLGTRVGTTWRFGTAEVVTFRDREAMSQ